MHSTAVRLANKGGQIGRVLPGSGSAIGNTGRCHVAFTRPLSTRVASGRNFNVRGLS